MMTVKLLSSPGSVATRGGPGLPHGVKITVLHMRGAVPSCDAARRDFFVAVVLVYLTLFPSIGRAYKL